MPLDLTTDPTSRGRPSAGTVTQYEKRWKLLLRGCAKTTGKRGIDLTLAGIVEWMIARKPTRKARTWQLYKSSAIHSISAMAAKVGDEKASLCREAIGVLKAESQTGCATTTGRTSSEKAKTFPIEDRRRIEAHLAETRSPNARLLCDYLLAGVRCGLRPIEWSTAEELPAGDRTVFALKVRNAKQDEERAHGEFRTLRWEELPADEIAAIRRWMSAVGKTDDVPALLTRLSDLLYKACRKIWPRRNKQPALYSARHEFASVCKLVLAPEEVAAVMGHATDETATSHYGRRRKSGSFGPDLDLAIRLLPRPDPEDVARVRKVLAVKLERLSERRKTRVQGM